MVLQADILQCAHACDVVILMHHKHGLGETVTCYGTEGAGVSFIGNKMDVKRSDGGEMALMLFKKFMQGEFYSVTLVAAMSKKLEIMRSLIKFNAEALTHPPCPH